MELLYCKIYLEYDQIPPRVEYELSEIGDKFRKVLAELEVWGNEYIDYMNNSSKK
ncbi:winged helix-turn-helix transcriptional regulator [Oribacterium sp. C9]|uniref:winged helix-turn-helix transcriptional regulator n=1 Tax=Oribacterium sp. C9 TaxID=1943579 RepID=UPI00098EC5FD